MQEQKKRLILTYPDDHTRAYTMSYDDGPHQDIRLMELCRKYGMGCTFAINSGFLHGRTETFNHLGYDVTLRRCREEELRRQYEGFEIAGHSRTHPFLAEIDPAFWREQVEESQRKLSELAGYEVCGFTYPCNSYNEKLIAAMRSYGVKYSRTTDATYGFEIPEDFMKWHPTCHDHDEPVLALVDQCVQNGVTALQVFYVWGHAYEFDKPDPHVKNGKTGKRWDDFEILLQKVYDSHAFWFADNRQVYEYLTAVKKVEITESRVTNFSEIPVYGRLDGEKIVLGPGESRKI